MCVCVRKLGGVVEGRGNWQIRLVWTILSIWFNWFVECAGACDSVQQMAFHRSESWHSSIDNEQSCICWYAKVPLVKAGCGPSLLKYECATLISNKGAGVALSSSSASSTERGERSKCTCCVSVRREPRWNLGNVRLIRLTGESCFLSN